MILQLVTSHTKMPSSCWGASKYRKVALLELDKEEMVRRKVQGKFCYADRIDERSKVVKRIIFMEDRVYKGSSNNNAYTRARAAAIEHAKSLNPSKIIVSMSGAEL